MSLGPPPGVDGTAYGDWVAERLRVWYEANREGWWYRFRGWHKWGADDLMIGLMNEHDRIERELHEQFAKKGEVSAPVAATPGKPHWIGGKFKW